VWRADPLGDLVVHAEAPQRARHARVHLDALVLPRGVDEHLDPPQRGDGARDLVDLGQVAQRARGRRLHLDRVEVPPRQVEQRRDAARLVD